MLKSTALNTVTKLIVPDRQYKEMWGYVNACSVEVGGIATIKQVSETEFEVDRVFITRQVASGAYLRLEDIDLIKKTSEVGAPIRQALSDKNNELRAKEDITLGDVKAYRRELNALDKEQNKILMQWHSHVNMGTSPSSTDYDTALRLSTGKPFLFMFIMNKSHANSCHLMSRSPLAYWTPVESEFNKDIEYTEEELTQAKIDIDGNVYPAEHFEVDDETGAIVAKKVEVLANVEHPIQYQAKLEWE